MPAPVRLQDNHATLLGESYRWLVGNGLTRNIVAILDMEGEKLPLLVKPWPFLFQRTEKLLGKLPGRISTMADHLAEGILEFRMKIQENRCLPAPAVGLHFQVCIRTVTHDRPQGHTSPCSHIILDELDPTPVRRLARVLGKVPEDELVSIPVDTGVIW